MCRSFEMWSGVLLFCLLGVSFTFSLEELQCKPNEVLGQSISKQIISNGCSKPSFIRIEGEQDFTYCCDRHDACYACCGISKTYCDDDFHKCMNKLCETNFYTTQQECKSAASTYALGTKVFGQNGFIESQNDYCECVPSNQIDQHYYDVIKSFYSSYVPEKRADSNPDDSGENTPRTVTEDESTGKSHIDVGKILKSYSKSGKKYHQLYYDLHKKYDHAIGHIEGRKHKVDIPRPPKKNKEL